MIENLNGDWISGFTDGEGCFHATYQGRQKYINASVGFDITLRADDIEILESIKKYFNCGKIYQYDISKYRGAEPNTKPIARFSIRSFADCYHVIIPHFVKFPLKSKKSKDFEIWKEIIELGYHRQHIKNFEYYRYLCDKLAGIRKFIPEILDKFIQPKSILQSELNFEKTIMEEQ
jgi:hypothetical protein